MPRIVLAQIDPELGAFDINVQKISEAYLSACDKKADLLVAPEMAVCGYPPHDLIERPEMFSRTEKALAVLAELTRNRSCALAVGHVLQNPDETGRHAQNAVSILENGKIIFTQAKSLLPTYDVFDEARYFEPATSNQIWSWKGLKVGIAVCEDLWADHPILGRRLYGRNPVEDFQRSRVDLVLAFASSPFEVGKTELREKLHSKVAQKLKAPILYVNQFGATDEILFDGGSFVQDQDGKTCARLPFFEAAELIVDFENGQLRFDSHGTSIQSPVLGEMELISKGLVTGIREYFKRCKFKKAILGLSGGIDSSVVAVLAKEALGAKNVLGVAMPAQHSSSHSLEDAQKLALNLGIEFEVRPIKFSYSIASREISENRGRLADLALENLQARLRGLILMTLSNHDEAMVLTTGNKSEMATGYCTLYGDMVGALAPIGDVLKTKVYLLAAHLNERFGDPIPKRVLEKAPSAELRPNQTDQDSLPPYPDLDFLLKEYLENNQSIENLKALMKERHGKCPEWFASILSLIERTEYKRRQAAPVLKISSKAFGIGRRIPIAKEWDQKV